MSNGIPVRVLVARLENELETARIESQARRPARTHDAVLKCQALAAQIREAL